ncbi:hypothetical protein MACK_002336 [Theileria orientalis]|uniref:Uncharacterized protein n=1 Tax=Theileria orientalis TaxID=68886 RepID=A0A976QUY0_THEOR|nr:hypothetical protein MACK_002336 [Theileria orientalis]
MGASYSDLNIYYHRKKGEYQGKGYKVVTTDGYFPGCSDFQVITHNISFDHNTGLYYNIILYDGSSETSKGSPVFGYYYPRNESEVIKSVRTYYSVLAPNVPLIVSFECPNNTYNCYLRKLREARWDRSYNITEYSFGNSVSKDELVKEFKQISRNRKIEFKIEKECKDITCGKQDLGDKKYFRLIFIPKGNFSVLGSDYLFAMDFIKNEPKIPGVPSPGFEKFCKIRQAKDIRHFHTPPPISHINQIDPYYLHSFIRKYYDGIVVYLYKEDRTSREPLCEEKDDNSNAILLEFYDSRKEKKYLKRKDKEGCWWAEEPVEYNGDTELLNKLREIPELANKEQVVTVIIDEKRKYLGLKNYSKDDKNVYTKYTFEFPKANKPILIFERKAISIGTYNLSSIKAIKVEVFYLKNKYGEDKQPFLIVFYEDRVPRAMKAYHFVDEYGFEKWKEFVFEFKELQGEDPTYDPEQELKKKLYEKVEKIEKYSSCILELSLIRWYAYKILTDPEFVPTQPPPKPPDGRPPIKKPQKQPDGPPIPWIVGGSVGGGVFVISSAALYGVYWYNTTIKLLT